MNKRQVRICFGRYGDRERLCLIMCQDCNPCTKIYWDWWFKNRLRRTSLPDKIKEFMKSKNLEFRMDTRRFKQVKREVN